MLVGGWGLQCQVTGWCPADSSLSPEWARWPCEGTSSAATAPPTSLLPCRPLYPSPSAPGTLSGAYPTVLPSHRPWPGQERGVHLPRHAPPDSSLWRLFGHLGPSHEPLDSSPGPDFQRPGKAYERPERPLPLLSSEGGARGRQRRHRGKTTRPGGCVCRMPGVSVSTRIHTGMMSARNGNFVDKYEVLAS